MFKQYLQSFAVIDAQIHVASEGSLILLQLL